MTDHVGGGTLTLAADLTISRMGYGAMQLTASRATGAPRDRDQAIAVLREAVASGYDVVVTTGGTGLTPADLTPEMTRRVIEREVPGIAEAARGAGAAAGVPSAILSRGVAGVAGRTLIVNLPGSAGGVRDGMAVLGPVLAHAISQINGGDHVRVSSGA